MSGGLIEYVHDGDVSSLMRMIDGLCENLAFRCRHADHKGLNLGRPWFRGSRGPWGLVPARFRNTKSGDREAEHAAVREDELALKQFKAEALARVTERPTGDGEWYSLARHHGLKTRLLDWTTNLPVALHFATAPRTLELALFSSDKERHWTEGRKLLDDPDYAPCLWVLWPEAMHVALRQPAPLKTLDEASILGNNSRDEPPIAVAPPRRNARIIAQSGYFTLHRNATPLDELSDDHLPWIARFKLDLRKISGEIENLGVTESTVYPSVESVCNALNGENTMSRLLAQDGSRRFRELFGAWITP